MHASNLKKRPLEREDHLKNKNYFINVMGDKFSMSIR